MKNDIIDCFVIHHVDPDGFCAGAIVRYQELKRNDAQNIECFGVNYGYDIPWNRIKRAKKIYLVDFSLKPNIMADIRDIVGKENFIWIDHHITVIDDVRKSGQEFKGLREVGKSGCELCWEWFDDGEMPPAVRVIGRYDVWDTTYEDQENRIYAEDIFPFIQGIKYHEARADEDNFWFGLFGALAYVKYQEILIEGRLLYDYQTKMYARYCKSHSFDMEWEGHRFLVVNALNCNSQMFDSKFNNHKYDAVMTYGYTNKNWSVSMYTDKPGINVGAIAHKYGGGGHIKAAGMHFDKILPFEHLLEWKSDK